MANSFQILSKERYIVSNRRSVPLSITVCFIEKLISTKHHPSFTPIYKYRGCSTSNYVAIVVVGVVVFAINLPYCVIVRGVCELVDLAIYVDGSVIQIQWWAICLC